MVNVLPRKTIEEMIQTYGLDPGADQRVVKLAAMALRSLGGVMVSIEHLENIRRAIERGLSAAQGRFDSEATDTFQHLLNNYTEMFATASNATQDNILQVLPLPPQPETVTTVTPNAAEQEDGHVETPECGFDRNGSHNAGHYVCGCGWEDKHE